MITFLLLVLQGVLIYLKIAEKTQVQSWSWKKVLIPTWAVLAIGVFLTVLFISGFTLLAGL